MIDRKHVVEILQDPWTEFKAPQLIVKFWAGMELCDKACEYFGRLFKANRHAIQVVPLSPIIFNLMVDAVIRTWLH